MKKNSKEKPSNEAVVIELNSGSVAKEEQPKPKSKFENNLSADEFKKAMTIIAFIASNVEDVFLGNTYKLMYIMDDMAASVLGKPITKCDYRIGYYGPLPVQLYCEINGKLTYKTKKSIAGDYIKLHWVKQSVYTVSLAKGYNPDMSIFTDDEISIINTILKKQSRVNLYKLLEYTRYGIISTYMKTFGLFDEYIGIHTVDFEDKKGVNDVFDEAYEFVNDDGRFQNLMDNFKRVLLRDS